MHKQTIKAKLRFISLCIAFCFIFTLIPSNTFAFTTTQLKETVNVNSNIIETGSSSDSDYLKLETSGTELHVFFKHSQEFDRIVLRIMKNGSSIKKDLYCSNDTAAGAFFSQAYDFSDIPDGNYHFRIVTEKSQQADAGLQQYSTYLQGVQISVKNGIPTFQQYQNITENNIAKRNVAPYELYIQKSLEDLRYQLFAEAGNSKKYRTVKSSEAEYYKKVSDSIVSSGDSDYTKLKKIFTFVAKNFYFDHYGTSQGNPGYDDPYYNLKYLTEKKGNSYNAVNGKVALQCDGYAGVYTALARAQGIPCRIVYGRRITSGTTSWQNETSSTMEKNTHTWVEAWVDNRWIIIDPQQGSYSSYSKDKKWLKTVLVNYTFFDVSDEMFSYSHYARTLPGGNKTAEYILDTNECSQLKTFLAKKYNGKTNGKRLNSSYSSKEKITWGTTSTLVTDGFGKVERINWPKKALKGSMDLSSFTSLKNLTVYLNDLTGLDTSECPALETVSASGNDITKVNLLASKSLEKADYKNNPLTKAQLYINQKAVTVSALKTGTFSFKYTKSATKKLTIYPKADIGYKYVGLYNSSGKRISTNKTSYTFNPTSKTYKLKFALDPNSYKYYLRQGNKSTLSPWNAAVQQRLKDLNYFKSTVDGKYNKSTTTAVKAFQKKNGLKQTGSVDEKTWKKLFSTKAKKK